MLTVLAGSFCRPIGGWLADRCGWTQYGVVMILAAFTLPMPGHFWKSRWSSGSSERTGIYSFRGWPLAVLSKMVAA